jgi:hypothetical protein
VYVCLQVASGGGTKSIILSIGGTERMMLTARAESMMLSARAESMDTLSASAESIILSALPAESCVTMQERETAQ